jgi:hypothetical protein
VPVLILGWTLGIDQWLVDPQSSEYPQSSEEQPTSLFLIGARLSAPVTQSCRRWLSF